MIDQNRYHQGFFYTIVEFEKILDKHYDKNETGAWLKQRTEQCDALEKKIMEFRKILDSLVSVKLSWGEKIALVSLMFSIGADELKNSTLLKELNEGRKTKAQISSQFLQWNKVTKNGRKTINSSLCKQRNIERKIFLDEFAG